MTSPTHHPQKNPSDLPWQSTACILCGINCGIEVQVHDRHIVRVRGDKNHPVSAGYLCQKSARIDYYQNHLRRLKHPLKRQPDGTFVKIDWDTAVPISRHTFDETWELVKHKDGKIHLTIIYHGKLRAKTHDRCQ